MFVEHTDYDLNYDLNGRAEDRGGEDVVCSRRTLSKHSQNMLALPPGGRFQSFQTIRPIKQVFHTSGKRLKTGDIDLISLYFFSTTVFFELH